MDYMKGGFMFSASADWPGQFLSAVVESVGWSCTKWR